MSVELWVDRVVVEKWGRASGMDVRLAAREDGGGFFVVCGPNESGKTSFAAALAWLIAGAGNQGVLQRFGKPGEELKARFHGRLGEEALRASVGVKVTGQREGMPADKQEKFQAELLEESLTRTEFQQQLGGGDFVGYRNFYWLEALEVAESEGMKETLSVKAMFGGINPDSEAERLEKKAGDLIGRRSNTPGSAWELLKKDDELQTQISGLEDEWRHLAEVEERLEGLKVECSEAQERRTAVAEKEKSVSLVLNAVEKGLLERRSKARTSLEKSPAPSPLERELFEKESETFRAAAELQAAEDELKERALGQQSALAQVHPGWRGLVSELRIDRTQLEEARIASARAKTRREDAERASEALASAKDDSLDLMKSLQKKKDLWQERAPSGLDPTDCDPGAADSLTKQLVRLRMRALLSGALGLAGVLVAGILGAGGQALGIALGLVAAAVFLASGVWCYRRWREVGVRRGLVDWDVTHSVLDLRRKLEDVQWSEAEARKGEIRSRESLVQARSDFESLLIRLGVDADRIGAATSDQTSRPGGDAPDPLAQLEAVVVAQQAEKKEKAASLKVGAVRARLGGLLAGAAVLEGVNGESSSAQRASGRGENSEDYSVGVLADADEVKRFLAEVSARIREYERLRQEEKEAAADLLRALRGDKAAEEMLESKSIEDLQADGVSLQSEVNGLDAQLKNLNDQIVECSAKQKSLESSGRREDLELDRGELATRIEEKLVSGLGRCLAANLLKQEVETHRKTRRPSLLTRAEGLAKEAADWTSITGNPHSPERDGDLLVESTRGEHPSRRLSLGAQSLLYLTLRLATIEEQSEARGVRLPLILDDVLVGIDSERVEGCLGVLSGFAGRHQVILLTCHEHLAERARSAGALVLDWPPNPVG